MLELIHEYIVDVVFPYDPEGSLAGYEALIEAWQLIATFVFMFFVWAFILRLLWILLNKMNGWFGGRW